jgi:PAS domain S-box-containing protein
VPRSPAAELLRAVTAAVSAGDEALLPGDLRRGEPGELGWAGGVLTIPVPDVGALLVQMPEPDEDLLTAAESAGAQLALWNETRHAEARRRAMLEVAFDSVVTMDEGGVVVAVNRAAERTFGYAADEMVGRLVADLIIPPQLRDAHREGLARYLKTGRGPIVGRRVELTAMRADGTEFPVELVVTRPDVPGERLFYGYLRDLTARYRAETALHRLADEQAALRRVATAVAAEGDPSRLFELVTEEVARLLDAETAALMRFDGDRAIAVGAFNKPGVRGVPAGTVMPLRADTAAGRVFRTGAPARVENYGALDGEVARELRRVGFHSSVAAPVFLGGRLWGAMVLLSVDQQQFPDDAEQRIAYFAELAAQALANAQAREELGASRARIVQAGDEERRRLERNLHDGAQQRLVSLALMLRLAARRHPDDDDLARAGEELSHALQELRELARGIHPAVLTERGLEPALRALADRAPVPVDLDFTPTDRLPGPVEAAAYYVVSEALTNVAKYAGASVVRVRVDQSDGVAQIEVADDGAGGADPSGGSGLRGLADRVEALGGRLTVDSPPGEGTTLRAELPTRDSRRKAGL